MFDAASLRRSIYLDGQLISTQIASGVYRGVSGNTTIGYSVDRRQASTTFPGNDFDLFLLIDTSHAPFLVIGYMDSLSIYIDRVKSSCETMNDATLVSYFSWDNDAVTDDGPNGMPAWTNGTASIGPGYKNQGLVLNDDGSYLTVYRYSILVFSNQPYSTSIWVRPTHWSGTIIHVGTRANGDGICWSMLGLTATGSPSTLIFTAGDAVSTATANVTVPLDQWTHIVQTFSPQNGRKYHPILGTSERSESHLFSNHCHCHSV